MIDTVRDKPANHRRQRRARPGANGVARPALPWRHQHRSTAPLPCLEYAAGIDSESSSAASGCNRDYPALAPEGAERPSPATTM